MMKKLLVMALGLGFLLFGIGAYLQSLPSSENKRVHSIVREYSPYYLDKRFGGLSILSKKDKKFKEKPSNLEVFHRLEALERQWASTHMKLENNQIVISDDNHTVVGNVPLKNKKELDFVHKYYGI